MGRVVRDIVRNLPSDVGAFPGQLELAQAESLTGVPITQAAVDLGYRGHGLDEKNFLIVPRDKR
ncbi:MAG: hypothetical protein HQL22_00385 [Candidatus Omnitrophica bacterium]|nr:hypothetical protein [Candidatus Omnitrophota bacterium]